MLAQVEVRISKVAQEEPTMQMVLTLQMAVLALMVQMALGETVQMVRLKLQMVKMVQMPLLYS
jgi:hypothetical protein